MFMLENISPLRTKKVSEGFFKLYLTAPAVPNGSGSTDRQRLGFE